MANFIAFQLDVFQNDAFQTYILETPVGDLLRAEKVYVQTFLENVFIRSVASRIYSTASDKNISVKSAMNEIVVQTLNKTLFINKE